MGGIGAVGPLKPIWVCSGSGHLLGPAEPSGRAEPKLASHTFRGIFHKICAGKLVFEPRLDARNFSQNMVRGKASEQRASFGVAPGPACGSNAEASHGATRSKSQRH